MAHRIPQVDFGTPPLEHIYLKSRLNLSLVQTASVATHSGVWQRIVAEVNKVRDRTWIASQASVWTKTAPSMSKSRAAGVMIVCFAI